MARTTQGKTRDIEKPYEIWEGSLFGEKCEWRVLKKYQTPENEAKNPYAIWFVGAKSAMTYGSWEYGDTYIKDINGTQTFKEDV